MLNRTIPQDFGMIRMIHDPVHILSTNKKGSEKISKPFPVIRLGLEPRTPTLKVLCSTC